MALITDEVIAEAARRLSALAPEAQVVLFGSAARGEAGPDSDLDLLVIEPQVAEPRAESARLRRELRELRVPLDLIVISEDYLRESREVDGSLVNVALREGRRLVPA